jgi:hypothetical protein
MQKHLAWYSASAASRSIDAAGTTHVRNRWFYANYIQNCGEWFLSKLICRNRKAKQCGVGEEVRPQVTVFYTYIFQESCS